LLFGFVHLNQQTKTTNYGELLLLLIYWINFYFSLLIIRNND